MSRRLKSSRMGSIWQDQRRGTRSGKIADRLQCPKREQGMSPFGFLFDGPPESWRTARAYNSMNPQRSCGSVGADSSTVQQRLAASLSSAKRTLIIGVGGGNDSVTTLLMKRQLEKDFGFRPDEVDIAAMLPDVLDYHDMEAGPHPLVWRVLSGSSRSVQGTVIRGFPEPVLARAKDRHGVSEVWGIGMSRGSEGVCEAIRGLIRARGYDLVLACD